MRYAQRNWRFATFAALSSAILSSATAGAQRRLVADIRLPGYRTRVLGVFDSQSGQPIESAEVVDLVSGSSTHTTKTGTISLGFLSDGGSLLRIRKVGYESLLMPLEITPLDSFPLTVLLKSAVPILPAVVANELAPRYASPVMRAFNERRSGGMGQFIGEAELRKQDGNMLNLRVQTLSGLAVSCTKGTSRCYAMSTRQNSAHPLQQKGGCPVRVLVDGTSRGDPDLANMPVRDYDGVEYYAAGASMPEQYNTTGNECGLLLLWTRER
jgi:hypothetical protein